MVHNSSASVFALIAQADIIVQLVMLILVLASIWSWTIIFDKICRFYFLKAKTKKFNKLLDSEKLDSVLLVAKNNDDHPYAKILVGAIKEWKISNAKMVIKNKNHEQKQALKQRIENSMQAATTRSSENLEKNIGILAIIASSAPFIGLFGTVWGIMNSFQGIAVSKNTSLAVVAPGIAEALLATALGLFAAIPALFFYNIFNTKINQFFEEMQNFSVFVGNVLSRELYSN